MSSVALVIGHGPKHDRGAVSRDKSVNELDWNRDLVEKIQSSIKSKSGLACYIVHRTIERLQPVKETNETNANIAIEFHLNSSDGKASGIEMIHANGSKRGKLLAQALQSAAVKVLRLNDRGVKTPWQGRGERWLKGTKMPAVIAESFFIDNDTDLTIGTTKKNELANAYADAIIEFLKG